MSGALLCSRRGESAQAWGGPSCRLLAPLPAPTACSAGPFANPPFSTIPSWAAQYLAGNALPGA
eukprot:3376917-Lingulodinium_polyedra.AAC.1